MYSLFVVATLLLLCCYFISITIDKNNFSFDLCTKALLKFVNNFSEHNTVDTGLSKIGRDRGNVSDNPNFEKVGVRIFRNIFG